MSLLDEDNVSSVYVWFSAMIWIIYTLILGAINVIHFRKTYQDLYTVERKSIAHRAHRSKNINSTDIFYKAAAILTCVLCFTYFMVALVIAILFNLSFDSHCNYLVWLPYLMGYQFAKYCLYSLFLIRLHAVYKSTTYKYGRCSFSILFIIISTATLGIWVNQIRVYIREDYSLYLSIDEYSYYCKTNVIPHVVGMF